MKCSACQAEVDANSVYCPKCGEKLESGEEQNTVEEAPHSEDAGTASEPEAEEQPTASQRLMEAARSGGERSAGDDPGTEWTEGGYSPKALNARFLATCLVSVLLLILASWLFWGQDWQGPWVWYPTAVLIAALWIWYLCVRIYRVWTIKYRLTAHQFYHEEGIFTRVRDVIEVIDIDDLKLERTLWDRLINGGVGTIVIQSADPSNPELRLRGLDNPDVVFQSLDDARRNERAARGLKSV